MLPIAMADDQPCFADEDAVLFEREDDEEDVRLDAEADADIAAGRVISWDAVRRWMLSWGTNAELPPPEVGD